MTSLQFKVSGSPALDQAQYLGVIELFNEDGSPFTGGGTAPTWATLAGKPTIIAAGTDQAAARTAIGAAAASHNHTGTQVTLTGYTAGTAGAVAAADTVNAAIAKLEARIAALEST